MLTETQLSLFESGKPHTHYDRTEALVNAGSHAEIQIENEHFRVTEWTIQPGGHIPMHVHEHEYVVIPMVTATMHVTPGEGDEFETHLVAGHSYSRPSGSTHQITNRTEDEVIVFVEVEKLTSVDHI